MVMLGLAHGGAGDWLVFWSTALMSGVVCDWGVLTKGMRSRALFSLGVVTPGGGTNVPLGSISVFPTALLQQDALKDTTEPSWD